jgi:signal transduction histidine kinase
MRLLLKKYFLEGGLDRCNSSFERNTVSIFNIITFSLLISCHISFLTELIGQNPKGIVFSILFIATMHLVIWLNRVGYYELAVVLFCLFLPTGVFLLALGYSNVLFIDFYFVVFFLTIIIFVRSTLIRSMLGFFYVGMYSWLEFFNVDRLPLFGYEFDITSNIVVFMIFLLMFWMLTHLLMTRFRNADSQKDMALAELQKSNTELEIATENMQRVSAMASHDLKTPIRNIKSMIGLIAKKSKDTSIVPLISDIDGLAGNMIHLIDQTIEHDRVKNLDSDKSILHLNCTLDNIVALIGSRFGDFELRRDTYIPFYTNTVGFTKVLQNLVENAAKYNTSTQKIISIKQEVKGDRILISVEDNGIGIDEEYKQQVFGMYTRLHTSASFPGTGLGLAICKRIIEQMNGDITIKDNDASGSSFIIDLPYEPVIAPSTLSDRHRDSQLPLQQSPIS